MFGNLKNKPKIVCYFFSLNKGFFFWLRDLCHSCKVQGLDSLRADRIAKTLQKSHLHYKQSYVRKIQDCVQVVYKTSLPPLKTLKRK